MLTQSNNNFLLNFMLSPKYSWIKHCILIVAVTINFNILFTHNLKEIATEIKAPYINVFYCELFNCMFSISLVYFNIKVLNPKLLFKNKFLQYTIALLLLVSSFFFLARFSQTFFLPTNINTFYLIQLNFSSFIQVCIYPAIFIVASSSYDFFKRTLISQQTMAILQQEKLNAELGQLKNQINPHFLFNTLNNLNVLVLTNSNKASEVIMGLSDVLRYQIYDSQNDSVRLNTDIEMLKKHLEIEKLRRDNFTFAITKNSNFTDANIPPLLFVNFVDNALKHSLDSRNASYININFETNYKQLIVTIINSIPIVKNNVDTGGLGLINSKRRLAILYNTNYTLNFTDSTTQYSVQLTIPL
jgi:sensor histidine kinase YesM